MNWRSAAVTDMSEWVQAYSRRRYGYGARSAPSLSAAMDILRTAAYDVVDIDESPIEDAPSFTGFSSRNTDATGLLAALRLFVVAGQSGEVDPALGTYQYDLTDLTRQVRRKRLAPSPLTPLYW